MIVRLFFILIVTFVSVNLFAQDIEKAQMDTPKDPTELLQQKIRIQQVTIDSLMALLMDQKKGDPIVRDIDNKTFEDEEIALGKLAVKLEQEIYNVVKEQNDSEVIFDYFLSSFSASFVSIDKDGKGNIIMATHENIRELFSQFEEKNIHFNIINIDFIDTEIVGKVFTIAYKTKVEYYQDGVHIHNRTILTTLTGKKRGNQWKIASLYRTSIEHAPDK